MHHTLARAATSLALAVALAVPAGCATSPAPAAPERPMPTFAAPSLPPVPGEVGEPTRLRIPAIGVDESLSGVGLKADGAMQTPDFGAAGWYGLGPRPGAPGPAVVLAHVHGPDGPDVFFRLHELAPGDPVTVHRTDGVSTFVVESVEQVRKEQLPYDRIWGDTPEPLLRLITCGGTPTPGAGYPDNTIVYLRLA
ncbi:sortase family protein [Aeromicrobium marinum DSM 15272]|uniref:Sortase family protein n=2 Tax=Aeromicrobium marinum TaxID=219314 RepID=E2SE78_9ACTN|nr:sortase family protein [Aeromicrobium marinum DSM 15272]